jgi:DNA-binding transcriptional LysR family regulator
MDRFSSMAVFVCVVEQGSFTAAAQRLRLSATMVGKHLRFLEDHLGARLLHRTTRRQSLTEAGTRYLASARQLLADVAAAEAGIRQINPVPQGVLRVASPVTFGAQRLAPALAKFLRAHPRIRVELTLHDRAPDLIEDGFDAAIRIGHLKDSALLARRLQPYRMLLGASPDYLAIHGTPKTPADLRQHNCLGFAHWDRPDTWRLQGPGGTRPVDVAGNFSVNHGFALRAAALAGAGIVMQPAALLADDVTAGRLIRILPRWEPPARPMHLVYLADRRMPPKLRAFSDFVAKEFG